jgi:hypothetical protein
VLVAAVGGVVVARRHVRGAAPLPAVASVARGGSVCIRGFYLMKLNKNTQLQNGIDGLILYISS